MFATVTMARVAPDRAQGQVLVRRPPAAALIVGRVAREVPLESAGIALGIDENATWDGVDSTYTPDTQLLLFTDGLIEGFTDPRSRSRLGDEGLRRLLDPAGVRRAGP